MNFPDCVDDARQTEVSHTVTLFGTIVLHDYNIQVSKAHNMREKEENLKMWSIFTTNGIGVEYDAIC